MDVDCIKTVRLQEYLLENFRFRESVQRWVYLEHFRSPTLVVAYAAATGELKVWVGPRTWYSEEDARAIEDLHELVGEDGLHRIEIELMSASGEPLFNDDEIEVIHAQRSIPEKGRGADVHPERPSAPRGRSVGYVRREEAGAR